MKARLTAGRVVAVCALLAGALAGPRPAGAQAPGDVTIDELRTQFYSIFPPVSAVRTFQTQAAPSPDPYAIVEREYLYAVVHDMSPRPTLLSLRRVRDATPPLVRTYAACVKIITPGWHGTGFLVSPAGDVVTCYHLIAAASTASVQTIDGKIHPVTGITAISATHDLALLKISGGPFPCIPTIPTVVQAPRGTPLFTIGHPKDNSWVLAPGKVIRWQEENRTPLLHFEADVNRGNSGGPVVDQNGALLAVTAYAAKLADGSHVKVGISWTAVSDLLDASGGPPMSFAEINAFHRNRRVVEFLHQVYGVGEDFMSELRGAMSRVNIESLTRAAAVSSGLYSAVWQDANRSGPPERVLLRNTQDCADTAAKLLFLRLLTERCLRMPALDKDLTASAVCFRSALDGLMDSVTALDRARGATTTDARRALDRVGQLSLEAQSSLGKALGEFREPARRYELPVSNPDGYERMEQLRLKYSARENLLPSPHVGS
jgi:serine protease Do